MSYICPAPDKNDEEEAELLTDLNDLANSSSTQVLKKTGGFVVNYDLLDTDGSLTSNSDLVTPTQKAVKTYIDSQITGENHWDAGSGFITPHNSTDSVYIKNNERIYSNSTDALIKNLSFYKSRGTYASPSVITTADYLGEIVAYGHDGTGYIRSGSIRFKSAGIIGTNRVPGYIEFYTGTDASPSVERLAMTIDKSGVVGLNYGSNHYGTSTYYRNTIGTTTTDAITLYNSTSSTALAPVQMTPRLRFLGSAWDTDDATSRTSDWIIENLPATGNTVSSTLKFGHSLAGGSYTYPMTLSSNGRLVLTGIENMVIAGPSGSLAAGVGSGAYLGMFTVGYAAGGNRVYRNLADTYPTLYINNAHASSTGNILDLQWQGVNRISFTKDGSINLNTTDNAGAGTININGNRYFHAYSPTNALDSNLFIGSGSGNFTMGGTGGQGGNNYGIGKYALSSNTTGYNNTSLGYATLYSNLGGYGNFAFGNYSVYSNTSGHDNIGIGIQSLYLNQTGSSNIAIGNSALLNTTISNLTSIGTDSLYSNTTGTGLVAVGYQAGKYNVKGTNNSYFGYQAGYSGTTVVSSITITNGGTGYTAGALIVDNTGTGGTGFAGSYTVSGGVINGIVITNYGSGYNTAPTITPQPGGTGAVLTGVLGSALGMTCFGYQAGYANTAYTYGTLLGYNTVITGNYGIAIGANATAGAGICQLGDANITKVQTGGDIESTKVAGSVILASPDGTRYKISVANGGTISVTAA